MCCILHIEVPKIWGCFSTPQSMHVIGICAYLGHTIIEVNFFCKWLWHCAFSDVQVFNPLAHIHLATSLSFCPLVTEDTNKKRKWIWSVGQRSWTRPLVFSIPAWWYGSHYQSCLQESGLSDCDQVKHKQLALYCLYSYAAGSVFPLFIHRVHKDVSLLSKPPCQFNPQFPGDQPILCNSRVVPF